MYEDTNKMLSRSVYQMMEMSSTSNYGYLFCSQGTTSSGSLPAADEEISLIANLAGP